jgi:hypothetical protein
MHADGHGYGKASTRIARMSANKLAEIVEIRVNFLLGKPCWLLSSKKLLASPGRAFMMARV